MPRTRADNLERIDLGAALEKSEPSCEAPLPGDLTHAERVDQDRCGLVKGHAAASGFVPLMYSPCAGESPIRVAMDGDLKERSKRLLLMKLNATEYSQFSIAKLQKIAAAVDAHDGKDGD